MQLNVTAMKTKIFLLIFLLFSILFARGQDYTYVPFVEEDTRWSYASITQVGITDYDVYYNVYQLKGDTTIAGLIYKKLLYGCSEDYLAALREENKKVFIKGQEDEDEQLLYDFNLQEGDWIIYNIYNFHHVMEIQVTKIDTIQIGETKRKRFFFSNVIWIEGIGDLSDFYPYQPQLTGSAGQGINYQKKGSEIVYKTDEWYFKENECEFSSINAPKAESVSLLFPNPVKDQLYLKVNPSIFEFAQIKDLAGRICLRSDKNPIDVFSLPEGIYILELKMKNNSETVYNKFIKGRF